MDATVRAYPTDPADLALCAAGLAEVRARKRPLEVRIGAGPLSDPVPARLLGYVDGISRVLNEDVAEEMGRAPPSLRIFSSASKSTKPASAKAAARTLIALGGALRMAGVAAPMTLELASPAAEVPSLPLEIERSLFSWLEGRMDANGAEGEARFRYALEHAAESMYGDFQTSPEEPPFRATIGGRTEGRFFAIRRCIRAAALAAGYRLAPCAAFILRSVRRPWYQPTAIEPPLVLLATSPEAALDAMDAASNPDRGGNHGLRREAKAVAKFIRHPLLEKLAAASASDRAALELAESLDLTIGARLLASTLLPSQSA